MTNENTNRKKDTWTPLGKIDLRPRYEDKIDQIIGFLEGGCSYDDRKAHISKLLEIGRLLDGIVKSQLEAKKDTLKPLLKSDMYWTELGEVLSKIGDGLICRIRADNGRTIIDLCLPNEHLFNGRPLFDGEEDE